MPVYEYECSECGCKMEAMQRDKATNLSRPAPHVRGSYGDSYHLPRFI